MEGIKPNNRGRVSRDRISMAEGGSLHREAIATVQLTYSSENPILVDYIKEEPEEEFETEVLYLSVVEQPPPSPTPQPSQAQHLPTTHQVWAGVSPVVSSLVPELPPRPTFFASNPEGYTGPRAPTRWQEAYNLYFLHEETNHKARQAVLTGCITFAATQRIHMSGLQECRRLNSQGKLAFCYLQYMLNFGKSYNYTGSNINK